MEFAEKITQIKPTDTVLEVGPGISPYPRSDVYLEKVFSCKDSIIAQRGSKRKIEYKKPIFYYDGGKFPFENKEFDYVICSHVIEHVENVENFVAELFRVASKGYLEYPLIYYEYLYNYPVHLNFLKFKNGTLFYQKKEDTHLSDFLPVQDFFRETLGKGYSSLVDTLRPLVYEAFEWTAPFLVKKTALVKDIIWDSYQIPSFQEMNNSKAFPAAKNELGKKVRKIFWFLVNKLGI